VTDTRTEKWEDKSFGFSRAVLSHSDKTQSNVTVKEGRRRQFQHRFVTHEQSVVKKKK
jgi:hypothetical protein